MEIPVVPAAVAANPGTAALHQLVYSVGLPFIALIVVLVLEAVGSRDSFRDWLINGSSDAAIAALGMSGHLFGDAVLMQRFGQFSAAVVFLTVLAVILCIALTLHLKRTEYFMNLKSETRVGVAVAVGFFSVAVVAVVASWGAWGV